MRGWVYLITNKAMPGLVKVGFTLKDPDLRARELEQTGVPHPFVVEYEVLINDPRTVEQLVHQKLDSNRERKEWFRCEIQEAINAIQILVNGTAILENYRNYRRQEEQVMPPAEVRINGGQENKKNIPVPSGADISKTPSAVSTRKRVQFSAIYASNCQHCDIAFTVTVTRHERGTYCPECHGFNNLSAFSLKTFPV